MVVYEASKSPTLQKLQYQLTAELKLLEIKERLTNEIYLQKTQDFEQKTGHSFEPLLPKTTEQRDNNNLPLNDNNENQENIQIGELSQPNYAMINNESLVAASSTNNDKNYTEEFYSKSSRDIFNSLRSSHPKTQRTSIFADDVNFDSESSGNGIFNDAFSEDCQSSSNKSVYSKDTLLHKKSNDFNLPIENPNLFGEKQNEEIPTDSTNSNLTFTPLHQKIKITDRKNVQDNETIKEKIHYERLPKKIGPGDTSSTETDLLQQENVQFDDKYQIRNYERVQNKPVFISQPTSSSCSTNLELLQRETQKRHPNQIQWCKNDRNFSSGSSNNVIDPNYKLFYNKNQISYSTQDKLLNSKADFHRYDETNLTQNDNQKRIFNVKEPFFNIMQENPFETNCNVKENTSGANFAQIFKETTKFYNKINTNEETNAIGYTNVENGANPTKQNSTSNVVPNLEQMSESLSENSYDITGKLSNASCTNNEINVANTYLTQVFQKINLQNSIKIDKNQKEILKNDPNVTFNNQTFVGGNLENIDNSPTDMSLLLNNLDNKPTGNTLKYFSPQLQRQKSNDRLIYSQIIREDDKTQNIDHENLFKIIATNLPSSRAENKDCGAVPENVSFKKPNDNLFKTPSSIEKSESVSNASFLHNSQINTLNVSQNSVISNVDDFNFFLKYRPEATSTPKLNKTKEIDIKESSIMQNNQLDKTQINYESIIQANDNFLQLLTHKPDSNPDKNKNAQKITSENTKENLSFTKMQKPNLSDQSNKTKSKNEGKISPKNIVTLQSTVNSSTGYDYKKYIKAPKLILNNSSPKAAKICSNVKLIDPSFASKTKTVNTTTNSSSCWSNVDLTTPKCCNKGNLAQNANNVPSFSNSSYLSTSLVEKKSADDTTLSETIYLDSNSQRTNKSHNSKLSNSTNKENDKIAPIHNRDVIHLSEKKTTSGIDVEIYNLQKAIEDSDLYTSTNSEKEVATPKSNQLKFTPNNSTFNKLSETSSSNATCAFTKYRKLEETYYSTSSANQINTNVKNTSNTQTSNNENKRENIIEENDANLNASLMSIFSNVDDQKFFSQLEKRPDKMSTPKRKTANNKSTIPDMSINNICLFSQENTASKVFDDFKSPNPTVKSVGRKPIVSVSDKSADSFKSVESNVSSESPVLSNRITMYRQKRKPDTESILDEIKKMRQTNIPKPTSYSCVIPTKRQITSAEKLYVAKRDKHDKFVLRKVEKQDRKMNIRNAKSLIQKCLEQTINDTMVSCKPE